MRARPRPFALPVALLFVTLGASSPALAHTTFLNNVPNAETFHCRACHTANNGGYGWNAFGQDILRAGGADPSANPGRQNAGFLGDPDWARVCHLDSDGDGLTNGQELGDPCCLWSIGESPFRLLDLSHPADASSVTPAPNAPDADGDGLSDACDAEEPDVEAPDVEEPVVEAPVVDAGTADDVTSDAGSPEDAGTPDAGFVEDAGFIDDAGTRDDVDAPTGGEGEAPVDAGADDVPSEHDDTGDARSSGGDAREPGPGCGATSSGGSGGTFAFLGFALSMLARARRRRR